MHGVNLLKQLGWVFCRYDGSKGPVLIFAINFLWSCYLLGRLHHFVRFRNPAFCTFVLINDIIDYYNLSDIKVMEVKKYVTINAENVDFDRSDGLIALAIFAIYISRYKLKKRIFKNITAIIAWIILLIGGLSCFTCRIYRDRLLGHENSRQAT